MVEASHNKFHPEGADGTPSFPGSGENWSWWQVTLYRIAVAAVFALFFIACFHGIANYWQWGHNGYNGAAFSQAARNSIRFGEIGQAQYHTGLRPPEPFEMYVHHPQLLHFHLIAVYRLLGFQNEWAGRLVPALYSFFTLILLFVMVRRLCGRTTALVAITIYALTPINLIFANMINHEQGGIFWCLMFLFFYILWTERYKWRYLLLCLLAVTVAVQFDWPGYYIAFFIALHALCSGLVRHSGWLRWRPEYTWIVVFSAVVLLNFLWFILWVAVVQDSMDKLMLAFQFRTSGIPGYYTVIYHRTFELQGIAAMILVIGWAGLLIWRSIFRKVHLIEIVPMFFILAQVIHTVVFKQAGIIHSYWTYYLSPAIAVGGAIVLVTLGGWLSAGLTKIFTRYKKGFWSTQGRRLIFTVIIVLFAAIVLFFQGRFAWRQLRWGFNTGAAAYNPNYSDQFGEIMWAKELAKRYGRRSVLYFIENPLEWRIEFMYYLDAPFDPTSALGFAYKKAHPKRINVLLVDLKNTASLGSLVPLFNKYRTFVWDRRFVAVESVEADEGFQAFVSEAQPATFWWRWLVNPKRPPVKWLPDPDPKAVEDLLDPDVLVTAEIIKGGYGGGPKEWDCPSGHVMSGLSTTLKKTKTAGIVVGAFRPHCTDIGPEDHKGAGKKKKKGMFTGPWLGNWTDVSQSKIGCKDGDLPVGMFAYLRKGGWIQGIGLLCAHAQIAGGKGDKQIQATFSKAYRTPTSGREVGNAIELPCPKGSVVFGFRGRTGDLIDATGISCAMLNADFFKATEGVIGKTPWKNK